MSTIQTNAPSATEMRSARKSVLIGVHCSPKLVQALDDYIEDQYHSMKRPEAIRKLLIEVLAGNYLQRERDTAPKQ